MLFRLPAGLQVGFYEEVRQLIDHVSNFRRVFPGDHTHRSLIPRNGDVLPELI